jgi:hypothetical protein
MALSKWECDYPGCPITASGLGSAAGLRAIGWHFTWGVSQSTDTLLVLDFANMGGTLFCPFHNPEAVPCARNPDNHQCNECAADLQAHQIQAKFVPEEAGPELAGMDGWVWLGDLSGFTIEPQGRPDQSDTGELTILNEVVLTHRCGWWKTVPTYDRYFANMVTYAIDHRRQGCLRTALVRHRFGQLVAGHGEEVPADGTQSENSGGDPGGAERNAE